MRGVALDHTVSLLYIRTALSFIALIYAILIIFQTRRILERPWAFIFIFIRVFLALLLRAGLTFGFIAQGHTPEVIKTVSAVLDLLTIQAIHKAYRELFPET